MISRTRYVTEAGPLHAAEPVGWGWSAQEPRRSAAPVRRGWPWKLAAAAACSVAAVALAGFLAFVQLTARAEQPPATRTDAIVALRGGAQRIGAAIALRAKGYAKRLLISGVNEKTSREEIARLNPGQRRLFDCCVDLDYRARNTIGNAIETRRWAERNQFDALIVVTSNYHMPRTLVELEHTLPNLQKISYPVAATIDPHEWWHNPSTARVLLVEYLKFLAVWVRTRFEDDPEHSPVVQIMNRPIQ